MCAFLCNVFSTLHNVAVIESAHLVNFQRRTMSCPRKFNITNQVLNSEANPRKPQRSLSSEHQKRYGPRKSHPRPLPRDKQKRSFNTLSKRNSERNERFCLVFMALSAIVEDDTLPQRTPTSQFRTLPFTLFTIGN